MDSRATPHLSDLLRSADPDSPQLVQRLIAAAREHLDADVSFLAEFKDGQKLIRGTAGATGAAGGLQTGAAFALDGTYCYRVTRGELPSVVPDALAEPRVKDLPITRQLNIGSYVGVPVKLPDGRLFGTLCCVSSQPDLSLRDRDASFMRVLADILGEELGRDETAAQSRRDKAARIRQVIEGQHLRAVFQPIVNLASETIVGAEALARFEFEPRRPPDRWFAEAWEVGLGVELEVAAIRAAVAQFHQLPRDVYLSVNVSPKTMQLGAAHDVMSRVPAGRLVVEVTEHAVVDDYELLLGAVAKARANGIRVAVDDVGAGYSGLSHILRLRPNIVKLDTTLTENIHRDVARQALASAVARFAERTGVKLVAEGIETAEDAQMLGALGVDFGQGYHYARPGPLPLAIGRES